MLAIDLNDLKQPTVSVWSLPQAEDTGLSEPRRSMVINDHLFVISANRVVSLTSSGKVAGTLQLPTREEFAVID